MKKIICILLSVLVLGASSFAQDKSAKKADKKEKKEKASKSNTDAAPTTGVDVGRAPAPGADAKAAKTKKDGTPDMRYKENKEDKKKEATTKTKKDGTPDMRYKENKDKKK